MRLRDHVALVERELAGRYGEPGFFLGSFYVSTFTPQQVLPLLADRQARARATRLAWLAALERGEKPAELRAERARARREAHAVEIVYLTAREMTRVARRS